MSSYIGKRGIPHASLFQTTRDLHANKRVCWSYLALTGMETPLYFRRVCVCVRACRLRPVHHCIPQSLSALQSLKRSIFEYMNARSRKVEFETSATFAELLFTPQKDMPLRRATVVQALRARIRAVSFVCEQK